MQRAVFALNLNRQTLAWAVSRPETSAIASNGGFSARLAGRSCRLLSTTPSRYVVKRINSSSGFGSSSTSTSTSNTSTSASPSSSAASASKPDTGSSSPEYGASGARKAAAPSDAQGTGNRQGTPGSIFNPTEGYLQDSQWSSSFEGIGAEPFDARISEALMAPVVESEIEIKPDGLLYLPEIKYRRILNRAFGPGGWGLVPRGAHSVAGRTLSREYALICLGRFISQARGEQDFFDESNLATATEGCKSNALVRCCKDLGIASELWDPAFITQFKAKYCVEEWVTHAVKGNKKRMWRLKDRQWDYPWVKK